MENLPLYIPVVFGITILIMLWLFYKAANHSKFSILVFLVWLIIQGILSDAGFYKITNSIPPRFILLLFPPLLFILLLFTSKKGKKYIDGLNPAFLALLHIIRIPVEITLYWLSIQKTIPAIMTFEGRNFDIISGLTAPLIFYFGFVKKQISRTFLLVWNFICLALLINIVVTAVLSAPFPFQQLAFNQPAIAILYFPFTWLPCCIVPLVLFCHLATIRQLTTKKLVMSN